MPGILYDFDPPDRFVAGTVGEPGSRTFYLQARAGVRTVSVALEKVQVEALAERVEGMLDDVRRRQGPESTIPAIAPVGQDDVAPLDSPVEEEFRVATLSLAWDEVIGEVVIEAIAPGDGDVASPDATGAEAVDNPDAPAPDTLRVHLTPAAARLFAKRALRVVAAGRPPCPLCGNPLDPQGHVCPRQNGHHRVAG
jgi:uncharacterized repeat protein (TIGR03847 family)